MSTRSTPIAIVCQLIVVATFSYEVYSSQVGIAAELPSGTYSKTNLDYKSFFEFLLEKGEAYEKIPLERFNTYTCVFTKILLYVVHPANIFFQTSRKRYRTGLDGHWSVLEGCPHVRPCRVWGLKQGCPTDVFEYTQTN